MVFRRNGWQYNKNRLTNMWKRKFEIDPINHQFEWMGKNTMDIKSAFFQGKPIEKDVYLKPSKEAHTKKIWKLDATVYGLGDTQRAWHLCVKKKRIIKNR